MKTLSQTAIALLILATPITGLAKNPRQLQANEHETNLSGVTTIEAPPAGFDPLSASDEELAYHGFPPRPDQTANPSAYAKWAKAMSASKTRVVPKLEQTGFYHGAGAVTLSPGTENTLPAPPLHDNSIISTAMSGYMDLSGASSYGPSSFYYVVGEFVVPFAQQAPGSCNGGWAFASAWDGLDGFGSSDLLQAGVEFDAYCNGATKSSYYSAWYEWYPYGEVRIPSLPVTFGNVVFVEVWHTSATQGYAYLVNETTGQSVQVGFTAYPGYSLVGTSAEWIVEDPVTAGTTVDFVDVPFWDGYAYTESSAMFDIATGTQIIEKVGATTIASPINLGPGVFVDIW